MKKPGKVVVESRRRLLDDFFKVDEARLRHERFDGGMSESMRRLSFERGDSVAAVIYNRDARRVLLVEQFRYPTYEDGPGWLVETVAGIEEPAEDPEDTVRREILEETGYEAEHVEPISTFYLSPGGSSERIHLYYAEVASSGKVEAGGGTATENEDIQVVEMSVEEARNALDDGRIQDAKTIIGLMWLLRRLDRS